MPVLTQILIEILILQSNHDTSVGVGLTKIPLSGTIAVTMSQDRLIRMVSKGDADGVGKGHVYYSRFNNKNKKDPSAKLELKKFNPVSKSHTVYTQKK
ncbi:MAG: ribosomal protein L33 [Candidatus Azotimanducaceae bacterium]